MAVHILSLYSIRLLGTAGEKSASYNSSGSSTAPYPRGRKADDAISASTSLTWFRSHLHSDWSRTTPLTFHSRGSTKTIAGAITRIKTTPFSSRWKGFGPRRQIKRIKRRITPFARRSSQLFRANGSLMKSRLTTSKRPMPPIPTSSSSAASFRTSSLPSRS